MPRFAVFVLSFAAVFAAAGCARTAPARFYTLRPLAEPQAAQTNRTFVLAVGPMSVAHHLDRPQIATRESPQELRYDQSQRWAEPLKDSIPTVLTDNLRAMLPGVMIVQYPGSETLAFDWRVMVQVIRLDASLQGDATLRAGWMILASGKDVTQTSGTFDQHIPVGKADYASVVEAESKLLAMMAENIAEAVRSLGPAPAP